MHLRSYALVLLGVSATTVLTVPTLTPAPGPTSPAKRQQQPPPAPPPPQPTQSATQSQDGQNLTASDFPPQPTRLATQIQDGQNLTASLVTTTVTEYENIRASIVVTEADPPMIVYPRQIGPAIAGAIAVIGISGFGPPRVKRLLGFFCRHYS
jgi:hypothetical protein